MYFKIVRRIIMSKIIHMSYSFNNELVKVTENEHRLILRVAYEDYIKLKSSVLSPSTIKNYYVYMRNSFTDLMDQDIYSLNNIIIQRAVNRYALNHSPKTVRNAFGLLHAVMSVYNPDFIIKATLPQKIKPSYIIPTTKEINTLIAKADDKIRLPLLLASQGGLRRSEIAALQLSDFNNLGVKITKAAVYDSNYDLVIKTTKTVAGTRFVPLSQSVIEEAYKYKYYGIPPATISNCFNSLVNECKVTHFSFHKLRHYFASELHANNIPDKYIAKVGGWSSTSVLQNIYEHTLKDKQLKYEKKITNIFANNFT